MCSTMGSYRKFSRDSKSLFTFLYRSKSVAQGLYIILHTSLKIRLQLLLVSWSYKVSEYLQGFCGQMESNDNGRFPAGNGDLVLLVTVHLQPSEIRHRIIISLLTNLKWVTLNGHLTGLQRTA